MNMKNTATIYVLVMNMDDMGVLICFKLYVNFMFLPYDFTSVNV